MHDASDAELLRNYHRQCSEEAFAQLVERHVNLVYSAALRHAGIAAHAEEITQAVFIILASKADRLRPDTVLEAWLYETTRLTALSFLRGERRRQAREQEAYMQSTLPESTDDSVWHQLAPLLDEAMARLGKKDREAVVLRYFKEKNLGEVAATMQISEAAAQSRVHRAVEKLRRLLMKRGVALSGVAISGAISAHSVQAAPVALAKSVTTVAIVKGATASTSTLTLIKGALKIMAWTKAKTAVIAGVAVILATGTTVVAVKNIHHTRKPLHLAAGALPQTLEELNAWYVEPPAGQNAATFNLRGIKARQISAADQNADMPDLGKLPPPDSSAPLPPNVKSALATFLQRNHAALQFFAQGAKLEQSRYPIDLNQGANTLLPHLAGVKSGTQICHMAAIFDSDSGNGTKAADDVLMAAALAHSLKTEPTYLSQLVRAANIALAADALNQSVNRTTLPVDTLTGLAAIFRDMEDYDTRGEGFNRALVMEKISHAALLEHPKELMKLVSIPGFFDLSDAERPQMIRHLQNATNLKDERDFHEETFQKLWSARQANFPDRLHDFADALHQRTDEASKLGLLLNKKYWSGVEASVGREAACLAKERLALTALALEQFRAAHGNRYPAGLSDLIPTYLDAPLMDPFDGQPLRYRKQGAGYVLYSIGPDLKDNGGQRMTGQVGDLVFAVVALPSL